MIALLLAALLPSRATCAPGFILSRGVTPAGVYTCTLWPRVDRDDVEPIASYVGRVACHHGAVPVVQLDGRRVACLRIGASA